MWASGWHWVLLWLLILLVVVTVLGIWRMAQIQARLEQVVGVSNVETRLVIDMRAIVYDRMVSLRNLTLLNEADDMETEMAKIGQQDAKYLAALNKLQKMVDNSALARSEKQKVLSQLKGATGTGSATGGAGACGSVWPTSRNRPP